METSLFDIHCKTRLRVASDDSVNLSSARIYFLDKPCLTFLMHLVVVFSVSVQRAATTKYLLDLDLKPKSPDSSKNMCFKKSL